MRPQELHIPYLACVAIMVHRTGQRCGAACELSILLSQRLTAVRMSVQEGHSSSLHALYPQLIEAPAELPHNGVNQPWLLGLAPMPGPHPQLVYFGYGGCV